MKIAVCMSLLILLWPTSGHGVAPRGRYTFPTEKIVRDSFTRLDWERDASTGVANAREAMAHCAALNLSGTGWRVPTVAELHTIVDTTRRAPALDINAFPNTEYVDRPFYTSTVFRGQTVGGTHVFAVNFVDGTDYPVENAYGHVRCVRYWAAP